MAGEHILDRVQTGALEPQVIEVVKAMEAQDQSGLKSAPLYFLNR